MKTHTQHFTHAFTVPVLLWGKHRAPNVVRTRKQLITWTLKTMQTQSFIVQNESKRSRNTATLIIASMRRKKKKKVFLIISAFMQYKGKGSGLPKKTVDCWCSPFNFCIHGYPLYQTKTLHYQYTFPALGGQSEQS